MIEIRDMVQWHRLMTPLMAPLFFWGALILALTVGVFGLISGLALLAENPLTGFLVIAMTIPAVCVVIAAARLISEFFLVSFRTNNHLYKIRKLVEASEQQSSSYTNEQQAHLSRAA
jgi:hypothetical protein